jgi:hypothetical protein
VSGAALMCEAAGQRVDRIRRMVQRAGRKGVASHCSTRLQIHSTRSAPRLQSRYVGNVPLCRAGASDLDSFRQIFIDREYPCVDDVVDAEFIIDCGANVGYSSA